MIGKTEIKLVQMADDTTSFVQDIKSLENMFTLLQLFEKYAGLNLTKQRLKQCGLVETLITTPHH